ncbi:Zgc 123010, partial [Pristimantis euphronides]
SLPRRFLGNRSYSYQHIGRHQEALQDAEKSLELQPHFIKGHFRKGKALKGLKRYAEAIKAFQQVLSCDLNHIEAAQEVAECQQKLQELKTRTQEGLPKLIPLSLQPTPQSAVVHNSSNKVIIPRTVVYTRSSGGALCGSAAASQQVGAVPWAGVGCVAICNGLCFSLQQAVSRLGWEHHRQGHGGRAEIVFCSVWRRSLPPVILYSRNCASSTSPVKPPQSRTFGPCRE